MPRANRCFVPGHAWHITHRCHSREFLLGSAIDRDVWRKWLYQARVRYGLCVLDYTVTSNHVHLLAFDVQGDDAIARSMQLIEGRTAQSHNRRRRRAGAFWEGRYHAVAVDNGVYLQRCLAYIDLNMVRAGVVAHPAEWPHGGYREIQWPRRRYRVIDLARLADLCGCSSVAELQAAQRDWVDSSLAQGQLTRDPAWTDGIAVGGEAFTAALRVRLGLSSIYGRTRSDGGRHMLREGGLAYG